MYFLGGARFLSVAVLAWLIASNWVCDCLHALLRREGSLLPLGRRMDVRLSAHKAGAAERKRNEERLKKILKDVAENSSCVECTVQTL